jgi:uncharacterized YigZ family protein
MNDIYKTITAETEEILYKEKNSKFFGVCFPVQTETQVKQILEAVRKKHPGAGHFCYAYQIGTDNIQFRANDDGEPNNSAGKPIFGQIQSFGLTNVLVVVVRYFGGTKLGVGGLINAYRTTALLAIDAAEIIEKTIQIHYKILFEYPNLNKIMRIVKEKNLEIVNQKMETTCEIEIATRKKNAEIIFEIFHNLFEITIKKLD